MFSKMAQHGLSLAAIVLLVMLGLPARAQEGGFRETFDDPDSLTEWEHSEGVAVVDGALQIEANNFAFHGGEWRNLTLTFRARLESEDGALVVSYSMSDSGSYDLQWMPDGLHLVRSAAENATDLASVPNPLPIGEWVQFTITVADGTHTVAVNGQTVLQATDPNPLPAGGVAFSVWGQGRGAVDDVTVSGEVAEPAIAAPAVSAEGEAQPAYMAESWVRLGGPPGGLGYDIRMQPDNPDIMYVTDAHAGVHKSVDGGHTWFPANNGIAPAPSGDVPIFCLTIDPHDYNTVWAGTQNGGHIYRSTDAGQSWQPRDNGIVFEGRSVRGITIDPNDPNTIYAGVEVASFAWAGEVRTNRHDQVMGEVYKSMDQGQTWTRIWQGNNLARYIWVDPRNSNRIYVSTGIFDRDAADSDVRAGVWGGVGVLRSDDGGITWTVLDERNGLGGRYITSLFMHPQNPDLLLASITETAETPGVYVTRDGGDSWQLVLDTHGWGMEAVEIAERDPNVWYAAGEGRIWRSDDAGATWQEFRLGTPDRDAGVPIDLQVDPRNPYRIFVNNYGGGNFLSEDGGQTWVDASSGYTGLKATGRPTVDPENANTVYAEGYRSTDGGYHWRGLTPRGAQTVLFRTLPDGSRELVAGDLEGRVWHSTDGETWQSTQVVDLLAEAQAGRVQSDIQSMRSLVVAPSDPDTLYVGFTETACVEGTLDACFNATAGLYRSQDGGYTWEAVNAPFNGVAILSIAIHPQDARRLYVGTARGLYESRDGGANWRRVESLAPNMGAMITDPDLQQRNFDAPIIHDVAFDPFNPEVLYTTTAFVGLWRSMDNGQTWQQANAGMDPNEPVYAILPDPRHTGVLYASSGLSGMFYSTDGAQTWHRLSDGLTNTSGRGLALSSDGSVLYMGTIGGGVFRLGTPPSRPTK